MIDGQQHRKRVRQLKEIWEDGAEHCELHGASRADIGKTMFGVALAKWVEAEGREVVVLGLAATIEMLIGANDAELQVGESTGPVETARWVS